MVAISKSIRSDQSRHCSEATLKRLLDETLPEIDAGAAESHLATCEKCQQALESVAGDDHDWTLTRDVLSDVDHPHSSNGWLSESADRKTTNHDSALNWLTTFLKPGKGSAIGRLDRYDVLQIIGVGGMGVVVSAVDTQLNRPVAIKFLAPHLAPLGTARRRFARESRAVAAVVHPSIMPIFGINEDDAVPYLVMPLIPGGSLQMRINREGPLPLDDVIALGVQIADGLSAAHDHGLVHRDVKPGNILVEENSARVLITDFGLARALDDASATVSGMIAGTPQYMSPEQATGMRIDHRSDLFSLGSVLYAMATGRPPFRAESPVAVLRRIADFPFTPASDVRDELPPWFDRLLERFLQKDPEQRIETASEARELLHEVQLHLRKPSSHELPIELAKPSAPLYSGIPRVIAGGLVALAILIIGVIGWPFAGQQTGKQTPSPISQNDRGDSRGVDQQTAASDITRNDASQIQPFFNPSNSENLTQWRWEKFDSEVEEINQSMSALEWNNLPVTENESEP